MACPHPTFFPEVLNNLAKASVRVQNSSAWAATYRGITLYFKERHEEEKEISDMIGESDEPNKSFSFTWPVAAMQIY